MSLPNSDPSLPSNPAPIFQDNSFVRGDHSRANNQAIWGNLDYLEALTLARALLAGSSGQDFSTKILTTNDIVHKNYNINDKIENVKDYDQPAATETGAIEILLPPTWVYHMPKFVIRLRSNSVTNYSDCFIHIEGHMHQTNRWNGSTLVSATIFGTYFQTQIVKFGYRTIASIEYPTLYIGSVADVWGSPQIQIESIHSGYADLPTNWLDRANYTISIVPTALPGDYTNQYDVTPSVYGNKAKVAGDLTSGGPVTIDTGSSQGVLLPEDGGLEYLANAVESGGSYTRKYANSAFRIKPSVLADHKTYIDTAVDGTAGSAITWDNILTLDHVLKTISGSVENPALTISYGTHVNITGVVVSIRSTMKINNAYIVEIGVSGTVTTTGLQTTIIIGFPGLTPVGGGGSVNGVIAGTTDQSLWTRRVSNTFQIETPSINAAGALTAEGTIEFSI